MGVGRGGICFPPPPAQQGDKKPRLDWINVLRNFVGGRPPDPRYHRHGVLEPIETVLTRS